MQAKVAISRIIGANQPRGKVLSGSQDLYTQSQLRRGKGNPQGGDRRHMAHLSVQGIHSLVILFHDGTGTGAGRPQSAFLSVS